MVVEAQDTAPPPAPGLNRVLTWLGITRSV
jgi:hypothetical protein